MLLGKDNGFCLKALGFYIYKKSGDNWENNW